MKKSLLALAALTAFAGAASAQSTVTIGGKLDLALGKAIGSADNKVYDSAGSRLYFSVVEDLGGGLKAVGAIETRFDPDTGATSSATNFWNGYSYVGLQGDFGRVMLGRNYTSSFIYVQNKVDPFGGDGIAAGRGVGLQFSPETVRTANMIRYDGTFSGLTVSADYAESGNNSAGLADATVIDSPFSVAVAYAAGPLFVGVSYMDPGKINDNLTTIGATYNFGMFTLRAGASIGKNTADADVEGYLIGANFPIGAGDFRIVYANKKVGDTTTNQKFGIGYHYNLSKRTKVYIDAANDSKVATEKSGYGVGIQHNF
jgi:predicted porin